MTQYTSVSFQSLRWVYCTPSQKQGKDEPETAPAGVQGVPLLGRIPPRSGWSLLVSAGDGADHSVHGPDVTSGGTATTAAAAAGRCRASSAGWSAAPRRSG